MIDGLQRHGACAYVQAAVVHASKVQGVSDKFVHPRRVAVRRAMGDIQPGGDEGARRIQLQFNAQ